MDNFLSAVRINRVMQMIQDQREIPKRLLWINRIPMVQALDGEIMARWLGRVHVADLIQEDQEAVTYSSGKMTFETYNAPKIKQGQALSETLIAQLQQLQMAGSLSGDAANFFLRREAAIVDQLRTGLLQRVETLLLAMLLDSFSYDRLGVKIQNASWGMPADLKVTVATAWTDKTNATPITDIWTLLRLAQVRYGMQYRRITLSRVAFDYMVATDEFQAKAKVLLPYGLTVSNLITQATDSMVAFAEKVLGMGLALELYDQRYWAADSKGIYTSANYHPINKVLLTDPSFDNDASVWDFANGKVMEPVVASMLGGGLFGGLSQAAFGPLSYATGSPDLNPPNITYWGVMKGFPRRHLLQSSAVLTVGSFTDPIPVGEPF